MADERAFPYRPREAIDYPLSLALALLGLWWLFRRRKG